jgi:hypothetical protein
MNNKRFTYIFLLGGYDLEMLTIKQILEGKDGCIVIDKHLDWNNAVLSAYKEELPKYADCKIFGIELKEDIVAPDNYSSINHHNDKIRQSSSLEQVANILELSLNRHQQLVAANDKGYIPAMKALDATKEEIEEIRRKDRAAQGITEDDERIAKESVDSADMSYPGLIIVKAANNRFSPIVDRLSVTYPYHSYLVHTENEICIYGTVASSFKEYFHDSKDLYYGGLGDGYAGLPNQTESSIKQIIDQVKMMKPISKHIFLFPFKYSEEQRLHGVSAWKRVRKPQTEKDKKDLFNEKQYFYPFVHDALYDEERKTDDEKEPTLLHHYERKIEGGAYHIMVNKREYILDIESINVNLYNFGLGILAIHLLNSDIKQSNPEDILKINQYGRRVMPPFYNDITNNPREELADRIKITWGEGESIEEDFMTFKTEQTWHVGSVVSELLKPLVVEPVIDDRMFTLCYYENNDEMARIANCSPHSQSFSRNTLNNGAICKDFWYKYVFVDGGDNATCNGDNMYKELLSRQTYSRWEHPLWGTEYGVSKYSLVALTTETAPHFLLDYFETIYVRLAELVLCQRAALVLFSGEARKLAANGVKENNVNLSTELSNKYIQFINNFCYCEVTAQDQGVELYALLKSTLDIDHYEASLKENILQLHDRITEEYNRLSRKSDEKREDLSLWLNKFAGFIIPITILTSLFGLGQLKKDGFCLNYVLVIAAIVLIGGIIGGLCIYKYLNSKYNKQT